MRSASDCRNAVREDVDELKIDEVEIYRESRSAGPPPNLMCASTKDGAVRGHVFGAAEEINLQLEDHLLNLQTMSGSRFVGRYAQKVRTWEKTLNLVVECWRSGTTCKGSGCTSSRSSSGART